MSGSAYSSWALVDDPVRYAVRAAAALNCTVPRNMMRDHDEIAACLRRRSAAQLVGLDLAPAPSFLASVGPSRDGILIPSDFGAPDEGGAAAGTGRKWKRGADDPSYQARE